MLPVRAEYEKGHGPNLMLRPIEEGPAMWYTLADVVNSLLHNGHVPAIGEAWEAVPIGRIDTQPLPLMGGKQLDLTERDLLIELGNIRSEWKRLGKDQPLYGFLEQGIKAAQNSIAWGIPVEIDQVELAEKESMAVVTGNGILQSKPVKIAEQAGKYYNPLIATHAPAGGRLLLGIAEILASEQGLSYAHTDTDGITLANTGLAWEAFIEQVRHIAAWFTPLSLYAGNPPLLELEDENYALDEQGEAIKGQFGRLYFVGIATKRYALYNKRKDGIIIIRAAKEHGLGAYVIPEYQSDSPISEKIRLKAVQKRKNLLYAYDLWQDFIEWIEALTDVEMSQEGGIHYQIPEQARYASYHPIHQLTLSTWDRYATYGLKWGLLPFTFFTVLPMLNKPTAFIRTDYGAKIDKRVMFRDDVILSQTALYRPYTRQFQQGQTWLIGQDIDVPERKTKTMQDGYVQEWYEDRRLPLGESVQIDRPMTIGEALSMFFDHKDVKTGDEKDIGVMGVGPVRIVKVEAVGKEVSRKIEELYEEQTEPGGLADSRATLEKYREIDVYASDTRDCPEKRNTASVQWRVISEQENTLNAIIEAINELGSGIASKLTGVSRGSICNIKNRKYTPSPEIVGKLTPLIHELNRLKYS
jgi:hypothetical protein